MSWAQARATWLLQRAPLPVRQSMVNDQTPNYKDHSLPHPPPLPVPPLPLFLLHRVVECPHTRSHLPSLQEKERSKIRLQYHNQQHVSIKFNVMSLWKLLRYWPRNYQRSASLALLAFHFITFISLESVVGFQI